jgi:hypothetical protein
VLYLPLEKSLPAIEEELAEPAKEEKLPENFGDYHNVWIKILEERYVTLYHSGEYAAFRPAGERQRCLWKISAAGNEHPAKRPKSGKKTS